MKLIARGRTRRCRRLASTATPPSWRSPMTPRSTIRRSLHALARECFYIGALGSKKTHARRVERLKAQGISPPAIGRIHAPIGLAHRGGVAARDRGRDHGRDHGHAAAHAGADTRRAAAAAAETARMKFGPVAPAEAKGGIVVHSIRKGGLVLERAPWWAMPRSRRSQAAGIATITVARIEPGDVSEDKAAARACRSGRRRGRAGRPRLHRPRQSVRRDRRRRRGRSLPASTASTRSIPTSRWRRFAAFAPGGRRQDDRDGEDHPVRGRRGSAATRHLRWRALLCRWCASRPIAIARVGVISTVLPGPRRQGDREDAAGDARAARPCGRFDHGRAAGRRTRPQRSPARSRRCSPRAPSL